MKTRPVPTYAELISSYEEFQEAKRLMDVAKTSIEGMLSTAKANLANIKQLSYEQTQKLSRVTADLEEALAAINSARTKADAIYQDTYLVNRTHTPTGPREIGLE